MEDPTGDTATRSRTRIGLGFSTSCLGNQDNMHRKVAKDNRLFVDAVLWIARTGVPWQELPERSGNWNSTWRRFDRWTRTGL